MCGLRVLGTKTDELFSFRRILRCNCCSVAAPQGRTEGPAWFYDPLRRPCRDLAASVRDPFLPKATDFLTGAAISRSRMASLRDRRTASAFSLVACLTASHRSDGDASP